MIPYLVSRVVCYVAGYIYPAYASYKTIKSRNNARLQAWLMYWTVLGMYTMVEYVADMAIFWFPFYYDFKMIFILWMMLPQTQGSLYIYQVFVEPYLASHEHEIDKTLQDAQTKAKALGLEYIKRAIAAVQKFVLDIISKAAAGDHQFASSASVQAAAAAPGVRASEPQPAPTAASGASGYLSWAYNIVSPKLTAVATMASQTVNRQLPSRPLPRPPVNLYSDSSSDLTPSAGPSGAPSSSEPGYFWRRQSSNAVSSDQSDAGSQSSGLGITTPISPEDQKRLDQMSGHLDSAVSYISRTYMSSSSSASGSATSANPGAGASNDVRRRTMSLYGEEFDHD